MRKDEEGRLKKLIGEMDKMIVHVREENDIEEMKVREKEQDVKLTDLKIREYKRSQIMMKASIKEMKEAEKKATYKFN
jgi:hypothetical protein